MQQLKERYYGITKGMNVDDSPIKSLSEYCILMQNAIYDEGGNIGKRKGSIRLIPEPIRDTNDIHSLPIRSLFAHKHADGTQTIIAFAGTYAFKVDVDNLTATILQTGLTDNTIWNYTNYSGSGTIRVAIFTNGEDKIQRYDSENDWTTLDDDLNGGTVSNIPYAKYVHAHKNHLFVAVIRYLTTDDWIYSHIKYSPIDWDVTPSAGAVADWDRLDDLGSEMDEKSVLTGMGTWGDDLIFFTRDRMMRLIGTSNADFWLSQIPGVMGTVSHNTIRPTDRALLFLSEGGIGAYAGGMPYMLQMGRMQRYMRQMDTSRFEYACAAYYKGNDIRRNQYKIWYTNKFEGEDLDYNNFALTYDIDRDAWMICTGQEADCCTVGEVDEKDVLYFGNKFGIIAKDDFGTTDVGLSKKGEAIDFSIVFLVTLGDLEDFLVFSYLDLLYGSSEAVSDFRITYLADEDILDSDGFIDDAPYIDIELESCPIMKVFSGLQFTQQDVWESFQTKMKSIGFNAQGRNLYLRFSNSSPTNFFLAGFTIRGYWSGSMGAVS